MMKFNKYTDTAVESAKAGAKILLKHLNNLESIDYKGKIDPVTIADKQSQKAIISTIKKFFPDHNIIAEEKDNFNKTESDYCWIIDPLDGTVNFVHGVPSFCVSIGLMHKKEIVSAVIYAPALNELFVAEKGKGSFLNGKKIQVSKINKMLRALPVTGFPYYAQEKPDRVLKNFKNIMMVTQGMRRFGSAAIDMAYVACGRFDFFWEEGLKPWDVAAGILIVQEAGGQISDYNNKNDYLFGQTMVASNKLLHGRIIKILKK